MAADGGVIDRLVVLLGIEVDETQRKKASSFVDGLLDGLAGVITMANAAGAALIGVGLAAVEAGDEAATAAEKIGVTTEELTALRHAAVRSDAEIGDLDNGLKIFIRTLGEAENGGKAARKAFSDLGLDWQRLARMPVTEAVAEVAEALKDETSESLKSAKAAAVFGRGFQPLIPMLNRGKAGIQALTDEAARLGYTISTEDAEAAGALDDAMKRLDARVTGLWRRIGFRLIPVLTRWADRLERLWDARGPAALAALERGVDLFAAALDHLAGPLGVVWGILSAWATVKMAGDMVKYLTALGPAGEAAAKAMTAFAASLWWVALIAAAALAVEDLWVAMNGGESVAGDVAAWFGVGSEFSDAMTGLRDLFAGAADFAGALGTAIDVGMVKPLERAAPWITTVTDKLRDLMDTGLGGALSWLGGAFSSAGKGWRDAATALRVGAAAQEDPSVRRVYGPDERMRFEGPAWAKQIRQYTAAFPDSPYAHHAPGYPVAGITNTSSSSRTVNLGGVRIEVNGTQDPAAVAREVDRLLSMQVSGALDTTAGGVR